MCESCSSGFDRREFLAAGGVLGMAGLLSMKAGGEVAASEAVLPPRAKQPARVLAAFLYPPADVVNALFDAVEPDDAMAAEAMAFKQRATRVTDVADKYFVDAFRAHRAVKQMMERYGADAITIECLMLKHRKPCISFAMNNGNLVPCGCENDLNATLTLMLGHLTLEGNV